MPSETYVQVTGNACKFRRLLTNEMNGSEKENDVVLFTRHLARDVHRNLVASLVLRRKKKVNGASAVSAVAMSECTHPVR